MKPKPFSALNHFTVPCATCAPTFVRADGPVIRGPGTALPPAGHVRGTDDRARRYNRDDVVGRSWTHDSGTIRNGMSPVRTAGAPEATPQAMRPAARTDRSDGSTR